MGMYTIQQALEIALKSVESDESLSRATRREVMEKINTVSKTTWRKSWNQETIRKAIHSFMEEHGRLPNTADLRLNNMPSEPTIRAYFHMNLTTLLITEFPEHRFYKISPKAEKYDMLTREEWLNFFSEQFNKHLCPEMNGRVYNQLRDRNTPTWDTIARYTGDITWRKLMQSAGVKYLGSRGRETAHIIVVDNAESPILDKLNMINDERRVLNEELRQILLEKPKKTEYT